MNAKFFHPKWEMSERCKSTQGSPTERAFSLLLRDRWEIGPILYHPMISVLCKGSLTNSYMSWFDLSVDLLFSSEKVPLKYSQLPPKSKTLHLLVVVFAGLGWQSCYNRNAVAAHVSLCFPVQFLVIGNWPLLKWAVLVSHLVRGNYLLVLAYTQMAYWSTH